MLKKNSNPAFSRVDFQVSTGDYSEKMTLNGAIQKSIIAILLTVASALYVWTNPNIISNAIMFGGGIVGFILVLIAVFKPKYSPILTPIYALVEGAFLGAISAFFEQQLPGLPMQAVSLTFTITLVMLVLFRTGVIKVTEKLRSGITAAIIAIALVYLISWIISLLGYTSFLAGNSLLSIGFSILIVGIAAFSLLIDFDNIVQWSEQSAPKYMEWFAALGLLVTLVWLYLEIIQLLAKISSRE